MTTYANLRAAILDPLFSGLNDADTLTAGNVAVIVFSDNTPYTWSGIGQKLLENGVSSEVVLNMRATLSALPNGGSTLDGCFLSGGFDCSDATNRALLSASEVTDPPDAVTLINAMLAVGIVMGTSWQKWGIAQPLLADITSARATNTAYDAITLFFNATLNPLVGSGTATPDLIKAAVAAWTP